MGESQCASAHLEYRASLFGEIVSEGVTQLDLPDRPVELIAVNLGPANLRQSTASLTGQLINQVAAYSNFGNFPQDYPGLQLWLDSSSANGVNYDANDTPDPIPGIPALSRRWSSIWMQMIPAV